MCDYQCTSVSFIKLSNRIESDIFSPNRNALAGTTCSGWEVGPHAVKKRRLDCNLNSGTLSCNFGPQVS